MLRGRIVMGITDKHLQWKLLEICDPTFDKAVKKCKAAELSREHARAMQKQADHSGIGEFETPSEVHIQAGARKRESGRGTALFTASLLNYQNVVCEGSRCRSSNCNCRGRGCSPSLPPV
ncbi:uncharacterized protein LOC119188892 isoform X1 [Manduca sexta]|uniref:uncharacterized protein LOC119188892 isoform X1 n=1 Tax=Manduca sexta TaxID=7130 RepID=UPI00188EF52E|nr:uncharacterized protein LOC119188892 isoform X1 [Manduca sexta]